MMSRVLLMSCILVGCDVADSTWQSQPTTIRKRHQTPAVMDFIADAPADQLMMPTTTVRCSAAPENFSTLTEAIQRTAPGGTVEVCEATAMDEAVVIDRDVHITGQRAQVQLSGTLLIDAPPGTAITLSGLNLSSDRDHPVVHVAEMNGGRLTIRDSLIHNGQVGVLVEAEGLSVDLIRTIIENNLHSGVMAKQALDLKLTIRDAIFNDTAGADDSGWSGSAVSIDCERCGEQAPRVLLKNVQLTDNYSDDAGATISLNGDIVASLEQCQIFDNFVVPHTEGAPSGAIFVDAGASLSLVESRVLSNHANGLAGGAYVIGELVSAETDWGFEEEENLPIDVATSNGDALDVQGVASFICDGDSGCR